MKGNLHENENGCLFTFPLIKELLLCHSKYTLPSPCGFSCIFIELFFIVMELTDKKCNFNFRRKRENHRYETPIQLNNVDHIIKDHTVTNHVANVNDASDGHLDSTLKEDVNNVYLTILPETLDHDYLANKHTYV